MINYITRKINGKCYNFALGLIEEWLIKQGHWTPEKAMELSSRLSKEVKKTVNNFFERRSKQKKVKTVAK